MRSTTSYNKGFTLVEMMVAVAISSLVLAALVVAFRTQGEIGVGQDQISTLQQNARAAMLFMQRDIRMAGYDPVKLGEGGFGITNIQFLDKDGATNLNSDTTAPPVGYSSITFTGDYGDGAGGPPNGSIDGGETITYRIIDFPIASGGDGILDLGRDTGGGAQLLAENIDAFGLAFAFDANTNGLLDTYTDTAGNDQIIWAIDSNNDNLLDRNLDTNLDGVIDQNDALGACLNCAITGVALPATINPARIRAVRIWVLAQSDRRDKGFLDTQTYVVGRQVITPNAIAAEINQGGYRRMLLETTVYSRDLL